MTTASTVGTPLFTRGCTSYQYSRSGGYSVDPQARVQQANKAPSSCKLSVSKYWSTNGGTDAEMRVQAPSKSHRPVRHIRAMQHTAKQLSNASFGRIGSCRRRSSQHDQTSLLGPAASHSKGDHQESCAGHLEDFGAAEQETRSTEASGSQPFAQYSSGYDKEAELKRWRERKEKYRLKRRGTCESTKGCQSQVIYYLDVHNKFFTAPEKLPPVPAEQANLMFLSMDVPSLAFNMASTDSEDKGDSENQGSRAGANDDSLAQHPQSLCEETPDRQKDVDETMQARVCPKADEENVDVTMWSKEYTPESFSGQSDDDAAGEMPPELSLDTYMSEYTALPNVIATTLPLKEARMLRRWSRGTDCFLHMIRSARSRHNLKSARCRPS